MYIHDRYADLFSFSLSRGALDYVPATPAEGVNLMKRFSGIVLAMLLCALLMHVVHAAPQTTPEPLPATIEFNRDIRPILSDKCFQCHGPALQTATVRFDLEDGAKHALSGGRVA